MKSKENFGWECKLLQIEDIIGYLEREKSYIKARLSKAKEESWNLKLPLTPQEISYGNLWNRWKSSLNIILCRICGGNSKSWAT